MAKDNRTYEDVCCVIGMSADNKPIWKKVGVKTKTKTSNRDVILLDRTFNPAGVAPDEHSKNSVPLYFFEQDKDRQQQEERKTKPAPKTNSYTDFDDDIPF